MKFSRHEHAACEPMTRHWEFGPHGEGKHGLSLTLGPLGGSCLLHLVNGSPEYPGEQEHIGL
jgi:hypothetical protein